MKIRRQHHVWQHYLRAWATADDRIYCGQGGRVFPVNAAKVAVQTDFYRLDPLTPADVTFIKNMAIKTAHAEARSTHEQLLGILTAIGRLYASGAGDGDPELKMLLDESVNNTVEQYHSSIETRSQPLLDAARRRGDVSFYADYEMAIPFTQFLGMQYFRTVGMRERMIEQVRDPYGADIARCWTILSLIYGTTIGGTLFVERKNRPLILIENKSDVPFITGDQPIINTAADIKNHLTVYYPLSPTLALFLEEPGTDLGYSAHGISGDQVKALNAAIASRSHRQIFGNSPAGIGQFIEPLKERA